MDPCSISVSGSSSFPAEALDSTLAFDEFWLGCEIFVYFFSSHSLKTREKICQFCSVCIFFEGSVFTFKFLNDKNSQLSFFDIINLAI